MTKPKKVKSKFMFSSLEEYANITGFFSKDHPNWEALKIIWDMSRTPNFLDEIEPTDTTADTEDKKWP
jgi:hypothetical protein